MVVLYKVCRIRQSSRVNKTESVLAMGHVRAVDVSKFSNIVAYDNARFRKL